MQIALNKWKIYYNVRGSMREISEHPNTFCVCHQLYTDLSYVSYTFRLL